MDIYIYIYENIQIYIYMRIYIYMKSLFLKASVGLLDISMKIIFFI